MANTVQNVALSVLAATATTAGVQLAASWVSERYIEFVSRARTHQLQHYASAFVPAPITAGSVSVTQGSNQAVLSTALASTAFVGWSFRSQVNWFVVVAVASDLVTLTLDSAYSEATNAAASYTLCKRFIPVMADARWISNFALPRRNRKLRHVTRAEIESRYSRRQLVGAFPWCWCEAPRYIEDLDISTALGTTGQKLIEVYPPSSIAENYVYSYWGVPPVLTLISTLPPEIDEYILREGVLIDVFRYKSEQAANATPPQVEIAGFYANKESRQRTIWEEKIQEAQVADAAYHNEITVTLDALRYADDGDSDIVNAHQDVMYGWTE